MTVNMPTSPVSSAICTAAHRLMQYVAAVDAAAPVRLFGSAAVAVRCPRHAYLWDAIERVDIADIDIVTPSTYRQTIRRVLTKNDLVEDYGSILYDALFQRLLFSWPGSPYTVEVFFDPLDLHHTIELGARLTMDPLTITLADLVVTKLQFEDLQSRPAQLIDLCIVLAEHQVGTLTTSAISANRIGSLTAQDWGLWRTVKKGLADVRAFAKANIQDDTAKLNVLENVARLQNVITSTSHTPRWKAEAMAHKFMPCLKSGKSVYEPANDPWADWRK